MAGLFTLLYATIWGTSKIVSTIMDENSKSKSKAEAIQKCKSVYSDRHGKYYSIRTDEQVYWKYDKNLKRGVYYKYLKEGGTVIVEDPEKEKIEEIKKQEEQRAISDIINIFKKYIRYRKYWIFLDKKEYHDKETNDLYFIDILIKLDENKIYYKYSDLYSHKVYLCPMDNSNQNWFDITGTFIYDEIKKSRENKIPEWLVNKLSSYDLILNYDFREIKNEIYEKCKRNEYNNSKQYLIDEAYERAMKRKYTKKENN